MENIEQIKKTIIVLAKIIRADGTIEDLGEIASSTNLSIKGEAEVEKDG